MLWKEQRIKPGSSAYKDNNHENATTAIVLKKDLKVAVLSLETNYFNYSELMKKTGCGSAKKKWKKAGQGRCNTAKEQERN